MLTHPTTKIQLISLNYIQIQTNEKRRRKSLILIQREKQNKKAKSYYIILLYIIKIELRCCGCATWLQQITEILLNF